MIDFPLNSNVAMKEIHIEAIPGYCLRPKTWPRHIQALFFIMVGNPMPSASVFAQGF